MSVTGKTAPTMNQEAGALTSPLKRRDKMSRSKYSILMLLTCGLLLTPLRASYGQSQSNQIATSQPAPCSSAEYRQLDFWVGDWDVYDDKGVLQGHNLVQKILGGCALQ